MAYSAITRNLRDGQLVIKDVSTTPESCTVLFALGDLKWTESDNTIICRDRGDLDHHRPGDQEPVQLSFGAKWHQLIHDTVTGSDPIVPYEMINNISDDYSSVSTANCGGQFCLKYEFTVTNPCGTSNTSEKITFAEVYKKTLECAEGDEYNTIQFTGEDFEVKPTIARV